MEFKGAVPLLEVKSVSRTEGGSEVVSHVSFTQGQGQRIAIAGATGSGKTTLLKLIAGLVQPTWGNVFFAGVRVEGPNEKLLPGHPAIAYLSQHFELRNHYRVQEVLAMASVLSSSESQRVYEVCRIEPFLKRWTHELSGGERQRVALARVLVTAPKLLLLDEPFSNLDPLHKAIMKTVVQDAGEQFGLTVLLVSHDPTDTLPWAEELIVMQNGGVVQQGSPHEVYYNAVNEYVAALFGAYTVATPQLQKVFGRQVPEQRFTIYRPDAFLINHITGAQGAVLRSSFLGSHTELQIAVADTTVIVHTQQQGWPVGDAVFLALNQPDDLVEHHAASSKSVAHNR